MQRFERDQGVTPGVIWRKNISAEITTTVKDLRLNMCWQGQGTGWGRWPDWNRMEVKGRKRSGPHRSYRTLVWYYCESNQERVWGEDLMKLSYGNSRNEKLQDHWQVQTIEMLMEFFSLSGIDPAPSWHSSAWLVASPWGRKEKSGVCGQHSSSLEGCPREPFMPHLAWTANAQSGCLGAAESKGEHGQLVPLEGL